VAQENLSQGTGMNAISLAAIRSWQAAGLQAGASQANVLQANVPQANVPSLLSSLAASQQCGPPRPVVSSGFRSLDQLLPAGGVRRGSLVEWLADDAAGAVALAAAVACRLAVSQTFEQSPPRAATIVVVDRGTRFHPPAVMPWLETGAAPAGSGSGRSVLRPQLVVARPSRDDDELWAIDQSLRCPGVAAVLAWPRRVHATAMRRWQLAARASGTVGLLVRVAAGGGIPVAHAAGAHAAGARAAGARAAGARAAGARATVPGDAVWAACREPSWADARVAVSPLEAAEGDSRCNDDGIRPGLSLAVRGLRLSLVGGPWAGDAMLEERSTELWLDLARGGESTRRRQAIPSRCDASRAAPSAPHGFRDGSPDASGMGGMACRAS